MSVGVECANENKINRPLLGHGFGFNGNSNGFNGTEQRTVCGRTTYRTVSSDACACHRNAGSIYESPGRLRTDRDRPTTCAKSSLFPRTGFFTNSGGCTESGFRSDSGICTQSGFCSQFGVRTDSGIHSKPVCLSCGCFSLVSDPISSKPAANAIAGSGPNGHSVNDIAALRGAHCPR